MFETFVSLLSGHASYVVRNLWTHKTFSRSETKTFHRL